MGVPVRLLAFAEQVEPEALTLLAGAAMNNIAHLLRPGKALARAVVAQRWNPTAVLAAAAALSAAACDPGQELCGGRLILVLHAPCWSAAPRGGVQVTCSSWPTS